MEDNVVFDIFVDFYSRLFTSSRPYDIDRVLEGVQSMVSPSMNAKLTKPYTREEVDVAIKNMALMIAPGPDRMPPIFYQTLLFYTLIFVLFQIIYNFSI